MTQNDMDDYFTRTIVGEELEQDATYTSGKAESRNNVNDSLSLPQQSKLTASTPLDLSVENLSVTQAKRNVTSTPKAAEVDEIPDSLDFSSLDEFSSGKAREIEEKRVFKHQTHARFEPALESLERGFDTTISSESSTRMGSTSAAMAGEGRERRQVPRRVGQAAQYQGEERTATSTPLMASHIDSATQSSTVSPLTKITLPTKAKNGFMGKSIRIETLVFAVLGVIVSFVLLIAAYSLWLQ